MAVVICVPMFVVTAGGAGAYVLLFGGLPGTVPEENPPVQAIPSRVFDAAGNQIAEFRQFDLTVPMLKEQIPQVLKDAVIASEDQNFYEHKGMDPEGLARAFVSNQQGNSVQGGSTITQQYVRRKYLTSEKSTERKFNEIILATRLERDLIDEYNGDIRKAKEEILFRYLDGTYFGGGAYGAGAAAQTYFRKSVADLTLSEAALLAGIIPSPWNYGPREQPNKANARRLDTLRLMLEQGRINQAQHDEAAAQHLWYSDFGFPPRPATRFWPLPDTAAAQFPYFVDYVRQYLLERYGPDAIYRQGLRIETTIDPKLQQAAEEERDRGLSGSAWPIEMSLVSVEPSTGYVKAFVGGSDFARSQVNLALGGTYGMQPGSAFKTFTVAKAFEDGYGPDTVYDAPATITLGGFRFKGGAGGSINLAQATAGSTNTYFVQLVRDLKPNRVAELAYRLGVTRINPNADFGLALTLGAYEVSPLDMAASNAVIANHGVKADATPVTKVVKNDGQTLEDNTGPRGVRVLSAPVADWTTKMLAGVTQGDGTGRRAALADGRPVVGKTGSAENYTAAWFVGYTPQLATAIWVGDMNRSTRSLYSFGGFGGPIMGGTVPAVTFSRFMTRAMEGLPVVDFAIPGVLPAPTTGLRKAPREYVPEIVKDCGGSCVDLPVLTTPPPPPRDEDGDGEPDPTTTQSTAPPTTLDPLEATTTTTRPRRPG